jgi:hypothetical protein
VVGNPEVIRLIRHGPLTAIFPVFPGRLQLPIPLGVNLLLRIFERQRRPGSEALLFE